MPGDNVNKRLRTVETPDHRDEETVLTKLFSRSEWPVFNEATKKILLVPDTALPKKPDYTEDNKKRIVSSYRPLAAYYGEIGTVTDVMIPLLVFATGVCNCDSERDFLDKYSGLNQRTGKFKELPKGWGRAIREALIAAIVASPQHSAEDKAKAVAKLSRERWHDKGGKHLRAFRKMWCVCPADKPAIVIKYPESENLPLTDPGCWFYRSIQLRCDGKVSLNSMSEYFACWDYATHGYDFVTLSELQLANPSHFAELQECGVVMSDEAEEDDASAVDAFPAADDDDREDNPEDATATLRRSSEREPAQAGTRQPHEPAQPHEREPASAGSRLPPGSQHGAPEARQATVRDPASALPRQRAELPANSTVARQSPDLDQLSAGQRLAPERQTGSAGARRPSERDPASGGTRQPPQRQPSAAVARQPPIRQPPQRAAAAGRQAQRQVALPVARPRIYRPLGIALIDDGLLYVNHETGESGRAVPQIGGNSTFRTFPFAQSSDYVA
jgi:hypothetical protein